VLNEEFVSAVKDQIVATLKSHTQPPHSKHTVSAVMDQIVATQRSHAQPPHSRHCFNRYGQNCGDTQEPHNHHTIDTQFFQP